MLNAEVNIYCVIYAHMGDYPKSGHIYVSQDGYENSANLYSMPDPELQQVKTCHRFEVSILQPTK